MSAPLLEIENLTVTFPTSRGPVDVVQGISFSLGRERLGIVGESGSGKSMAANTVMGLLPKGVRPVAGRVMFEGEDVLTLDE
ncbi:ATP-binding cassette domain-containing protein, partial [Pantoea sp. SIMBA_133]